MSLDLRGRVNYGRDFTQDNLANADIRLTCATFHGAKLSPFQVAMFLKMFALADIDPRWKDGLHSLTESILGAKKAQAIDSILKVV